MTDEVIFAWKPDTAEIRDGPTNGQSKFRVSQKWAKTEQFQNTVQPAQLGRVRAEYTPFGLLNTRGIAHA